MTQIDDACPACGADVGPGVMHHHPMTYTAGETVEVKIDGAWNEGVVETMYDTQGCAFVKVDGKTRTVAQGAMRKMTFLQPKQIRFLSK